MTTEHAISTILDNLSAQADRIVSMTTQIKDGLHLTHPLMSKTLSLHTALTALQHIAQWSDPGELDSLDEPHSTTTARQTLESIRATYGL